MTARSIAATVLVVVAAGCAGESGTGRAGAEFRDCPDCPVMRVVPAGTFTMGSPESETEGRGWPAKTV